MGRAQAPSGFYTASQAIKKLGVPKSTFHDMVKRGQIKKVVPPNKSDGFYLQAEINKMAKAHELFLLEYATDTSTFVTAQEDDIGGIADLNAELFGGTRASRYNLRLSQYQANPEIFHLLKQDDVIVGYIGAFPLKKEAIDKILSGMPESRFRLEVLAPEYITQFKPGEADHIFLIIGVKQGLKKSRFYGSRVVEGSIEFLEELARRGVIVKKLYGTSRTHDGIRISRKMGFKQVTPVTDDDDLLRFELDLETTTNRLFREYQTTVKQATTKASKNGNQPF